jgi:hypothetical protein
MFDLKVLMQDPDRGIEMLLTDFEMRMKDRNVSADAIEGMLIAIKMAFRLGEISAAHKIMKKEKEESSQ